MNNKKITKTIIKGLKEVIRCDLTHKVDGEPKLKELKFLVESDAVIDEYNGDLIVGNSFRMDYVPCFDRVFLRVLIDGSLKECKILRTNEHDGVKTIIVNEIIETEHQDYLEEILKQEYQKQYDEYFEQFIEQYKDNKGKIALINTYLNTMTKEEVVALLKEEEQKLGIQCDVEGCSGIGELQVSGFRQFMDDMIRGYKY